MLRKILMVSVAIIMITTMFGCLSQEFLESHLRKNVKVEMNDYSPWIKVIGIESLLQVNRPNFGVYFIRSFIYKKDKSVSHQLYVDYNYYAKNWYFYDFAYAKGGERLEFEKIDSDVDCSGVIGCSFDEIFGIELSNEFLEENRDGFSIQVESQAGRDIIISVEGYIVSEQLDEVERLLASLGSETD